MIQFENTFFAKSDVFETLNFYRKSCIFCKLDQLGKILESIACFHYCLLPSQLCSQLDHHLCLKRLKGWWTRLLNQLLVSKGIRSFDQLLSLPCCNQHLLEKLPLVMWMLARASFFGCSNLSLRMLTEMC